ncbi:MAG: alpha/beta fold hydrolase [Alphaproteobacteria bacterium]
MAEKLNLLFIHGAWHGAWCWAEVTALAKARGHNADAIDLPGHGRRQNEAATIESYGAAVAEALGEMEDAVVIGHSMGGMAISAGAERAPRRIRSLIYLCSFLPLNGDSLTALAEGDTEAVLQSYFSPPKDGRIVVRDEGLKPSFYADCSDAQIELARLALTPQQLTPLEEPISLSPSRFGSVPKAYVFCEHDRAIGIAKQRAMAARAGATQTRALPTSHSPFFSAPVALLDAIEDLA